MQRMALSISPNVCRDYLARLLRGKRHDCRTMVESLLQSGIDVETLYVSLFQKSLYEVGELWASNQISVATEHLASIITEDLIRLAYPHIVRDSSCGKRILVSCAANEHHQIGGRIIADLCECRGWDTMFLGANTPTEDMLKLLEQERPDLVGLSVTVFFNVPRVVVLCRQICQRFPSLPIIVGGQALRWGGLDVISAVPGVSYIGSVPLLKQYLSTGNV